MIDDVYVASRHPVLAQAEEVTKIIHKGDSAKLGNSVMGYLFI